MKLDLTHFTSCLVLHTLVLTSSHQSRLDDVLCFIKDNHINPSSVYRSRLFNLLRINWFVAALVKCSPVEPRISSRTYRGM